MRLNFMAVGSVSNNSYISSVVQDIKSGKPLDYAKVKADYQKTNPQGNFEREIGTEILKLRMSGQADTDINAKTITQLQKLASSGSAPSQVSFAEPTKKSTQGTLDGEFNFELNSKDGKKIDPFIKDKIISAAEDKGKKVVTNVTYNDKEKAYALTFDSGYSLVANPAINIKTDEKGQLYYEKDGLVANHLASSKIKTGIEKAVKDFGIDATMEERGNRTYIIPKTIAKNGINVDAQNVKFEISEKGIKIKADKAAFSGDASVLSDAGLVPKDIVPENSKADVQLKGSARFSKDETKVKLDSVSADLKVENNGKNDDIKNFVKSIQAQAKSGGTLSKLISKNLSESGVPQELINTLLIADDKKINTLLSDPKLTEKLRQSALSFHVDIKNIDLTSSKGNIAVDGKNASVSASSALDTNQELNFNSFQKLKDDSKSNPLIRNNISKELGNNGIDSKIFSKIKNQNDFNKLTPEVKEKLQNVLKTIYGHQELANTNLQADTLHANIGDKTSVSATGAVSSAVISNGVGRVTLSAQAKTLDTNKEGKVATATGATVGVKAENIKLTKEDLQKLSEEVGKISQKIETEIQKIGLTKEQFLGITKAVTNIGNSRDGSIKNQISNIAKSFKATDKQVEDFMNLFSNKEFTGMLSNSQEILNTIKASKNGGFNLETNASAEDLSVIRTANSMLTTAKTVSASIKTSTSEGTAAASATFNASSASLGNGKVVAADIKIVANANAGKVNQVKGTLDISKFDTTKTSNGVSTNVEGVKSTLTDGAFKADAKLGQVVFNQNIGIIASKTHFNADYNDSHLTVDTEKSSSSNKGVVVDKLHAVASASRREGKASGNLSVDAHVEQVRTETEKGFKDPTTILNGADIDVKGGFKTPFGAITDAKLKVKAADLRAKPSGDVEGSPSISSASGNVKMTYAQLKHFVEGNPNGKSLLDSIKASGIKIPEGQTLDFKIEKGSLESGVFSGNINLPSFDSGLGEANISLKVNSGNLASSKVNLGGVVNLNLDTDKLFTALKTSLKLDNSVTLTKDENNQIKAKLDGFVKSGQATVSVENNEVKIHIDKAEFIQLFSVKGKARESIESMLKDSKIGFSSNGNNLSIPIKELTNFMGANDLTISNVSSDRNNNYRIPFTFKN